MAAGEYPAEVATMAFGHGTRLTDTEGLTLYQYENDLREPGTSTCIEECAVRRPPLLVADLPQETPEHWTVVARENGVQQWAYRGMPLYRYARDSHKGAAYGEGNGWSIAFVPLTTPSEIAIAHTVLGDVLIAPNGQTLYVRSEAGEPFDCTGECRETWLPLAAPWGAVDYGEFSVVTRDDGVYQWTYRSKPLYLFSGDAVRGDVKGQGAGWEPMVLEPALPVPEWITVVSSDGGALYALPRWQSL